MYAEVWTMEAKIREDKDTAAAGTERQDSADDEATGGGGSAGWKPMQ